MKVIWHGGGWGVDEGSVERVLRGGRIEKRFFLSEGRGGFGDDETDREEESGEQ